jgi:hypothetical protein
MIELPLILWPAPLVDLRVIRDVVLGEMANVLAWRRDALSSDGSNRSPVNVACDMRPIAISTSARAFAKPSSCE